MHNADTREDEYLFEVPNERNFSFQFALDQAQLYYLLSAMDRHEEICSCLHSDGNYVCDDIVQITRMCDRVHARRNRFLQMYGTENICRAALADDLRRGR